MIEIVLRGDTAVMVNLSVSHSNVHPQLSFIHNAPCEIKEVYQAQHTPPRTLLRLEEEAKPGYYKINVDGDERIYFVMPGEAQLIIGKPCSIYQEFIVS